MTDDVLESITSTEVWTAAPDGMLLVDETGAIRAANSEADRLFGHDVGRLVGNTVESLLPADQVDAHAALRRGFNSTPRRRSMGAGKRLWGRRADDSIFPVHIALSPLGESGLTIAAVRDMSEHAAFEERLIESTRRRLLAEDHERIARDLHDTVIQELFALGMTLQATLGRITDDEVARRIDGSVATLDDVIHSIRALIFDIGQSDRRDQSGLRSKLVAVAASFTPSLGFEPAVSFRGPIDTAVPEQTHEHVIAVVREGLANVARHADATGASVTVSIADGNVSVRVSDDGRGLAVGSRRSGLANLLDRALSLGGTCEVGGDPEGGTVLGWAVPITTG